MSELDPLLSKITCVKSFLDAALAIKKAAGRTSRFGKDEAPHWVKDGYVLREEAFSAAHPFITRQIGSIQDGNPVFKMKLVCEPGKDARGDFFLL